MSTFWEETEGAQDTNSVAPDQTKSDFNEGTLDIEATKRQKREPRLCRLWDLFVTASKLEAADGYVKSDRLAWQGHVWEEGALDEIDQSLDLENAFPHVRPTVDVEEQWRILELRGARLEY